MESIKSNPQHPKHSIATQVATANGYSLVAFYPLLGRRLRYSAPNVEYTVEAANLAGRKIRAVGRPTHQRWQPERWWDVHFFSASDMAAFLAGFPAHRWDFFYSMFLSRAAQTFSMEGQINPARLRAGL